MSVLGKLYIAGMAASALKVSDEKSQEQLRKELYETLRQQGTSQYLQEIAMPGVVQPVDTKKI